MQNCLESHTAIQQVASEFLSLFTSIRQADLRDMPRATWRDVLAGVLDQSGGEVYLDYLYEQIGSLRKAQKNPHWKEKVHQTLQINPI